jgi:hypothetical protein
MLRHEMVDQFLATTNEQYGSLLDMDIFEVLERASITSRALPTRWVFTYKIDEEGYFIKCKARLCV